MSKSKILTRLEYALVIASAVGLLVAFETKQRAWWATLPITGTLAVNLLNRKREDLDTSKIAIEEVNDFEQRMLNKIQWLEDKVKGLPPIVKISRIEKLEAETKKNREILAKLEKSIANFSSLGNILPELQKNVNIHKKDLEETAKAIAALEQTIESLPTRKDLELQTKEAFNILQFKQKSDRDDIESLQEKLNSFSSRREEDLAKLNNEVARLATEINRQFGKQQSHHEYEDSELELVINEGNPGFIPREIENLKEQNTDFQSAILQLQKVFKELPSHQEIENFKQRLLEIEAEKDREAAANELHEIRAEIAALKDELARQKLSKELALEQPNGNHQNERQSRNILNWFSSRF